VRTKKKVVPNNIETSSLKLSENSEPKPFIFRLVNYSDSAVWGILSLTLVAGFLVVGVPLISAIQIWCALILYSVPFYLTTFIKLARIRSIDSVVRVVIAFGLGSISLALIFGFTPIAMHPWLFWTIGIGLSAFSYLHFRVTGRNFNFPSPEGNQSSSKSMLSLLMIPVLVVAAALALFNEAVALDAAASAAASAAGCALTPALICVAVTVMAEPANLSDDTSTLVVDTFSAVAVPSPS
jgi:hypothetical protein